jgi:hypothetical protein
MYGGVVLRARCVLEHGFRFRCLCAPQSTWQVHPRAASTAACDDCRCTGGCMFRRVDLTELCRFAHLERARAGGSGGGGSASASATQRAAMYNVSAGGAHPRVNAFTCMQ